ncbi:MAG: SMC-Scp complex subunit ScpB [Porticoccaceae bacterium]|nr:SMC-Scp complex subunit ScpB [Porticoccaceae bacterium]MDG1474722.1 SMC-Scp complex subunit ScpB [Porticoccaceae bacterium]
MKSELVRKIIEGAILAAGKPVDLGRLESLFDKDECPPKDQLRAAIEEIQSDCRGRGFELVQVASGYRFQVRQDLSSWVNKLWEEKPKRYSRAMLETLALVAYRQPLTRGDIESVRGVAVSSDIIKSLQERDWVRVVGHRDVPGRPALYATTKGFLDYFNLKSLEHLPALNEIKDFSELDPDLELALAGHQPNTAAANDNALNTGATVAEFNLDRQQDGVISTTDQSVFAATPESSLEQDKGPINE